MQYGAVFHVNFSFGRMRIIRFFKSVFQLTIFKDRNIRLITYNGFLFMVGEVCHNPDIEKRGKCQPSTF